VHYATLTNKKNKKRVRVRRDFKGAKIIDLEAKVNRPINHSLLISDLSSINYNLQKKPPKPPKADKFEIEPLQL